MAGAVLSTAAAPLSVRRLPAAARWVPTSTECSRGAEACRFGHITRAARCLLACWRLAKTPGSSPSLPAAAGMRAGTPGSTTLCAGLRARPRREPVDASCCPRRSRRGRRGSDGRAKGSVLPHVPIWHLRTDHHAQSAQLALPIGLMGFRRGVRITFFVYITSAESRPEARAWRPRLDSPPWGRALSPAPRDATCQSLFFGGGGLIMCH